MNTDITFCSASDIACPMTASCHRASWRKTPHDCLHLSFADFGEELVWKSHEGIMIPTCPFFILPTPAK